MKLNRQQNHPWKKYTHKDQINQFYSKRIIMAHYKIISLKIIQLLALEIFSEDAEKILLS